MRSEQWRRSRRVRGVGGNPASRFWQRRTRLPPRPSLARGPGVRDRRNRSRRASPSRSAGGSRRARRRSGRRETAADRCSAERREAISRVPCTADHAGDLLRSSTPRAARESVVLPAERLAHLGQRLQVPLVFAGEAQHQVAGAGLRVSGQPGGDARRRSGVADLAPPQYFRRLSVVALQERVQAGRSRAPRPRPATPSDRSPRSARRDRARRPGRPRGSAPSARRRPHGPAHSGTSRRTSGRRVPGWPAGCRRSIAAGRPAGTASAPARRRRPASARPSPPPRRSTAPCTGAAPPSSGRGASRTARRRRRIRRGCSAGPTRSRRRGSAGPR